MLKIQQSVVFIMETHPVPQQISSYQFRLVGDMTLKQFFQVAGGVLVGLLFYSTHLPGIIKWFFIIISGLIGVALAFLPFEDRPLEKWIISFFRSVYTPTIFNWKQTTAAPVFFQNDAAIPAKPLPEPVQASIKASPLEAGEQSFLTHIYQDLNVTPASPPTPMAPIAPGVKPLFPVATTPQISHAVPTRGFVVPQAAPVTIPQSPKPQVVVEETKTPPQPMQIIATPTGLNLTTFPNPTAPRVQFSPDAAPPNPPTVPNTVSGQTVDINGKIIEGAIMEVRDAAGRPVRALKTNKVGHFTIVTPLINGKYEIIAEKDNYVFDPASFDATGDLIPPIAIRGKQIV
ncbi:MAG: PrgI family mobile element protein [Candidatus Microgenomates bacterium]|jgi:hypothetical protein